MDGWSHFLSAAGADSSSLSVSSSVGRRFADEQNPRLPKSSAGETNFLQISSVWNRPHLTSAVAPESMGTKKDQVPVQSLPTGQQTSFSSESATLARRNLAKAFELHVEPMAIGASATPVAKPLEGTDPTPIISPTGVTELNVKPQAIDSSVNLQTNPINEAGNVPFFHLHPDLQRDLSQALVDRVSFYAVIHDINKEANSMASNDFATLRIVKSMDEEDEVHSPLVMAVNGRPSTGRQSLSLAGSAMIDEETWLLRAIKSRADDNRSEVAGCPPTFLQAMGERDYEKPISSMETSRTQLWKPSRSWWEAKSGKNPWIEPMSHNKRWRYLWPLIHYHKFLAKCIKKLKRNGVDVKVAVSPVAVFLREEVCSVSDHLAAVSLFSSEEWMACLAHFGGWIDTSPRSEAQLRSLISGLSLRPLNEPGDIDSPLLRSQIDEQFLRTMIAAREQISDASVPAAASKKHPGGKKHSKQNQAETQVQNEFQPRPGLPLHPQSRQNARSASFTPRTKGTSRSTQSARTPQSIGKPSTSGEGSTDSRPSYVYPGGWQDSRNGQPPFVCDDLTSVHSTLSGDSHYHFPGSIDYGIYSHPPMGYYPPAHGGTPDQSFSSAGAGSYHAPQPGYRFYYSDPYGAHHWYGQVPIDPNTSYGAAAGSSQGDDAVPGTPGNSASPPNYVGNDHELQTPSHRNGVPPMSPFWADHLHSTLGMAGVYTPAKPQPATPMRSQSRETEEKKETDDERLDEAQPDAQPLLINHFYPYGSYSTGEVPPSPATQFMMSPQDNYHYYGNPYSYAYVSPRRNGRSKPLKEKETPPNPKLKSEASTPKKMTSPVVVRKTADDRTVATAATAGAETQSVTVGTES